MEPVLRFPVNCPLCGEDLLTQMPMAAAERALSAGAVIGLRSNCHGVRWEATDREVEQIRQYFDAVRVATEATESPSLRHLSRSSKR